MDRNSISLSETEFDPLSSDMAENKYLMCLKLGCLSLLWPSGLICKLFGTPPPVIGETVVKLMDADALPVLVTKDFPHELLIGSDAISRGNGKIDYGTRKVTSFGQNFSITPYTDFIPHTASVWELLPPLHQWLHEGVHRSFWRGPFQPWSLESNYPQHQS